MASVFANGIWKSGNNLLLKLCAELGVPFANFGLASSSLLGNLYLLRSIFRGNGYSLNGAQIGLDVSITVSERWLNRKFSKLKDTCIGGHAAFSDNLLDIIKTNNFRPIQIVRDPRDIVVSFAHWVVNQKNYYAYAEFKDLNLEERMIKLITGFRGDDYYYESLATVLDKSYGWLTRPNDVLVVKFEDLVGQSGGGDAKTQKKTIANIQDWINIDVADIDKVSQNLFGNTHTFRKGKIGSWQEDFTTNVEECFSEYIGDRIKHWGYS